MTEYILSELYRNEFRCNFSIEINGQRYISDKTMGTHGGIKIDTGAVASLIPLRTLGVSLSKIEGFKYAMVKKREIAGIVKGVESTNRNILLSDVLLRSDEEIMQLECMKFLLHDVHICLDDLEIALPQIAVTTDTIGNILLGMDVLKYFDTHISRSRITNKETFIGCPLDNINANYQNALYDHFAIREDAS